MPSNSTGTISVVVPVQGKAFFAWSSADDLAACSSIPAGGTALQLPNDPSNGDTYAFADVDGSCSGSNPLTILASSGTTIRGASSFAVTSAFAAGRMRFTAATDAWALESLTSTAAAGNVTLTGDVEGSGPATDVVTEAIQLQSFAGPLTPPENGSWAVAAWWISPAHGSNSNPGTEAEPLETYSELARRWGTVEPVLNQATTIQYLDYPSVPASDPIIVRAKGSANLTIAGPGVTQTPVITTTIAGLSALSTSSGTGWEMTAWAGAAVGQMVINASRSDSVGFVSAIVSSVAVVTQPMAPSAPNSGGANNNAWADGDSITVYPASSAVDIIEATYRSVLGGASFVGLALERLNFGGEAPRIGGDILNLIECYASARFVELEPTTALINIYNGYYAVLEGGPSAGASESQINAVSMLGGAIGAGNLASLGLGQNTYIQGTVYAGTLLSSAGGFGVLLTDGTAGDNSIGPVIGNQLQVAISGTIWGPSTVKGIYLEANARGFYANPDATQAFLGGVPLLLNNSTSGLSRTTTDGTYTWFGPIAITPANLNAAAGNAGFGGTAFAEFGSACLTNQANI